jgi:phosphoribosyl 1,2-cyclic phosphodiesterase
MRLTFLGTGSAEGYPHPFCRCAHCARARALGGPSLRRRAAALIGDDLLLDLGPDVPAAAALGRSLARVRHCLLTHAHADHLDAALARDLASAGLLDRAAGARLNLAVHRVAAGQPFAAGRYRVTAFPASHDPAVEPLLYAIEADGRCIFYGTDTAALAEAVWAAFHRHKLRFDVVILDHTYGPGVAGDDHLGADGVIEHTARLRAEGLLAEGGRVLATHLSHAGNPPHPELAAIAARHGYEVAHDGLTV